MKKIAYLTFLFCFCSTAAWAQSEDDKANSSSVYSKLGVGFPVSTANTAAHSMGLTGVSYNETYVPSIANPAHWGNTVYGMGSGGIKMETFSATDANDSARNFQLAIDRFQLQLPIFRGKLGVSASFDPLTEARYRTYREDIKYIGEGLEQDTLAFGIENKGGGGINRAEFGLGWRITPNISVGYAASAVIMSLDDTYSSYYGSSDYRTVSFRLKTSGVGFGNRFGSYIRLPKVFGENDQFGLGATLRLPVTIGAEREQISEMNRGSISLTNAPNLGDGDITLPMAVNAGISYWPTELSMFAFEGVYEQWSSYENDFKPTQQGYFTDRYKIGLGYQYFPYLTGSNKFLSHFKYRLGASYDTGHLKIRGEQINTLKFSLGLGILSPKSNSNSSIDLSLEYGIRGTKAADLVKEQIWGVRLSVNLSEIMFFRPKLQ